MAAAKLHSQITATGRFSVEVWGKPDHINQGGPARVVSYSADRRARNFTLAHGRWPETNNDLTLRARTSETGDNGEPPIYAPGALDTSSQHLVVSYDGEVVRFFRNGGKISSGTYGHLRNWNAVYPLVLGNETTGDRGWVGELYSVAVYDYALTAMEIQEKLSRRGKSSTNNSRH